MTLAVVQCDAGRRKSVIGAYVHETVRHAGNPTYHFMNLLREPLPNAIEATPSSSCQPMNLETVLPVSTGRHHVSALSLCPWFINVTHNPYRVCNLPLFLLPHPRYIGGRGRPIVFDQFLCFLVSFFLCFFVSKITRKRLDRFA